MKTYYRVKVERDNDAENPRTALDNLCTMLCWHRRYTLGDENDWAKKEPSDALKSLVADFNPDFESELESWHEEQSELRCSPHAYSTSPQQRLAADRELEKDYEAKLQEEFDKHYVSLPCYLMDHSGLSMSTGSFGCPWDSGQVGFIYLSHQRAHEELGGPEFSRVAGSDKTWTEAKTARVLEYLEGEVETYTQYLEGDVYGVTVDTLLYEFEIPEGEVVDPDDHTLDWQTIDDCSGFFGDDIEKSGMRDHVEPYLCETLQRAQDSLDTWVLYEHTTTDKE